MSLAAGEVFAGYAVVRPLESGGPGDVYLAQHPHLSRQDVLRVLPATASADGSFRARFEREAGLAATLWHPNIVGTRAHGEERGRLWIATEFVQGTEAARLVRDHYPNGMPAELALDIVTAVADALDYAHGRQLRHGAVSPANIVVTAAPHHRILLRDFGIPRNDTDDDQHDLATTAYQLLSGTRAFAHPLGYARPDLAAFDPALGRALATDPAARFATCLDFATALREGVASVTYTRAAPIPSSTFDSTETGPKQPVFTPAWSEEPAPNPYLEPEPEPDDPPTIITMPPDEHPASRTWALAGIGAVVVLVIALVVVVMTRGSGPENAAEPTTGPQPSSSTPAPPPVTPDTPPTVAGPDGMGETCPDGYAITGRTGWASHAARGNPAATCTFVGNVLKAYWNVADPSSAPRTVVAAGAIPCGDGAQCSGAEYIVTCAVEPPEPWITCRGGRDAVVYLY